jgi:glutamate N-acetyltransferase / amino-acid N-acetyltransferase
MTWPQGFRFGTVSCGLKSSGDPDLAVVLSETPCVAAGVFTTNLVSAAPVRFCQGVLARRRDSVRAVVINSKNANAVTGEQGDRDAARLAELAAAHLGVTGSDILVMSTGVIGQPMPMGRYEAGLERVCALLDGADADDLARAMMTTDTYPKVVTLELGATRWLGVAKGAGMIHPDMATLLGLVVTDARVAPEELQLALSDANHDSFHSITVDGDSSTNDTLLVLANGAAGPPPAGWQEGLRTLLMQLARLVAFDGEGASHRVTLRVNGLPDAAAARRVGRTILTSPLVKTAIAGKDANWGRILAAAGRAGVTFDPSHAELYWNGLQLLREGTPTNPGPEAEKQAVQGEDVELVLTLGSGPGQATLWSCDLTHEYISINGDYRS